MIQDTLKQLIEKHAIRYINLQASDLFSKPHLITLPVDQLDPQQAYPLTAFNNTVLCIAEDANLYIDPFSEEPTLNITCDIIEAKTQNPHPLCTRSIAKQAQKKLDNHPTLKQAQFGMGITFFIFENIRYQTPNNNSLLSINKPAKNYTHRPAPIDPYFDIRQSITTTLGQTHINVTQHQAISSEQCFIQTAPQTLIQSADHLLQLKHIVKNICHAYGKTATFMPKPLVQTEANHLTIKHSITVDQTPLFNTSNEDTLSQDGQHYLAGIVEHLPALLALTRTTANSYKTTNLKEKLSFIGQANSRLNHNWLELHIADPALNPYLALSAIMLAGLDGLEKQMPFAQNFKAGTINLQTLPNLVAALDALKKDHQFLIQTGVISEITIEQLIESKQSQITYIKGYPHPSEFELYYCV